jgi:hypothetical protein
MKSKLKFILPLIVVLGAGAFTYKSMTKPKPIKLRVAGSVYTLPQKFLLNTSDGEFASFSLTLILPPGQSDGASASAAAVEDSTVGDTLGTLPEEALVRWIVTQDVSDQSSTELLNRTSNAAIRAEIMRDINTETDVKVSAVYMPDLVTN